MNAEEPTYWLYHPTERFFDDLAVRHNINVDPFDTLAIQSRQMQHMSYIRRSPPFTVSDKDAATPAAEELQGGWNRFKVSILGNI